MTASTIAIIGTSLAVAGAYVLLWATLTAGGKTDRDRTKAATERNEIRKDIGTVKTAMDAATTERADIRTEIGAVRTDIGTILQHLERSADGANMSADAETDARTDTGMAPAQRAAHMLTAPAERDDK